jgi:hypothetical protein
MQLAWERFAQQFTSLVAGPVTTALDTLARLSARVREGVDAMRRADPEFNRLEEAARREQAALQELIGMLRQLQERREANRITQDQYVRQSGPLLEAISRTEERVRALVAQLRTLANIREPFGGWVTTVTPELPQAPALDPDAVAKAQFAVEQWLAAAQGQRTMLQDLNASWQTHADIVAGAVERISAVQQSGAQREIQIARVRQQLATQYEQQIVGVARAWGQAITALWPKQKGAAIATALINTAAGVTEAMKLPFPLNWAQAAAVAAMGLAQVTQIRSTGRALFIQGLDPAALFSGRQVEDLIRAINTEVQNGATLISTRNLPI